MDENKPTDDDYGLPEEQFEPINRSQSEENTPLVERRFDYNEKKSNSGAIAIVIVAFLLVAGAIFSYFYFFDDSAKDETAQNQFQDVPIEPEEESINQDFSGGQVPDNIGSSDWEEAETTTQPSRPAKPAKGTIEMVNARTGNYHIVIGSFIDDDLARDHGNKLAKDGVSTKIIVPYEDIKFYRLSVADYPTVEDAINHLGAMKTIYGNDIWVLKY